jgi:hypothetical protein
MMPRVRCKDYVCKPKYGLAIVEMVEDALQKGFPAVHGKPEGVLIIKHIIFQ